MLYSAVDSAAALICMHNSVATSTIPFTNHRFIGLGIAIQIACALIASSGNLWGADGRARGPVERRPGSALDWSDNTRNSLFEGVKAQHFAAGAIALRYIRANEHFV